MKNVPAIFSRGYMSFPANCDIADDGVANQDEFEKLVALLFNGCGVAAIKAADAVEQLSLRQPLYLTMHKNALVALATIVEDNDLKCRLARILPRLCLTASDLNFVFKMLYHWAAQTKNNVNVRSSALIGLGELTAVLKEGNRAFCKLLLTVEKEHLAALQPCILKLKSALFNC